MTAPIRPDPVADYLAKYGGQKAATATTAPVDPVQHYLTTYGAKSTAPEPGVLSRAGDMISAAIPRSLSQLGEEVASVVTAPIKSAFTAAVSPSIGATRPDARLSKGGNSSGRAIDTTPYDAEHGGITGDERLAAGAQTLANALLPRFANLGRGAVARLAGIGAGGALAGAAYNPDDLAAGAVSGAVLGGATHVLGNTASGIGRVAMDIKGRPATTAPVKVLGVKIGDIQSLPDRAAEVNARVLANSPSANGMSPTSTKPVTPMDVNGTAGVRAVRGLKTSSPAAESVIRDALKGRADNAVDRVIQHGLETTGLKTRENGVQIVDDMIAQRAQHGNENYQPVFAKYTQPLTDPEFAAIANTPAGQQAMKRAGILAANRGEPATASGSVPAEFDPSTLSGTARELYDKLLPLNGGKSGPTIAALRALGETVPEPASGGKAITPTLKQAHYVKLAFDDMLSSAPEPGTGGLGPNNASAIRGLKARLLSAMDKAAPEYQQARQTFADESELIRGAELGRNLWKLHPDEAAKAMRELPQAAQDVARRTGFDALAERIENGPADVERGVGKPRDQKRIRLLFPDDQSFEAFRQGLKEEAQMHANERGALDGSNTADKLADMANMAGVTLPDVVQAVTMGRTHRLVGRLAGNATRAVLRSSSDALAAERARQLVAGANGDAAARTSMLDRLRNQSEASNPFVDDLSQSLYNYYRNRGVFLPTTRPSRSGSGRNAGTRP